MAQNRLRQLWEEDKPALGCWLSIPDSFCAEMIAHLGFDWLCIDMQHGLIDYQRALTMLQAISDDAGGARRARALERPGDHHEDARRRRLRGHRAPDRDARRRRKGGRGLSLPSGRWPQLRAHARRVAGAATTSRTPTNTSAASR